MNKERAIEGIAIIMLLLFVMIIVGVVSYNSMEETQKVCKELGANALENYALCYKIEDGIMVQYDYQKVNGKYYLVKQ